MSYTSALIVSTGKYSTDSSLKLVVPTLAVGASIDILLVADLRLPDVDNLLNHIYGSTHSLSRHDLDCAVLFNQIDVQTYDVVVSLDCEQGLVPQSRGVKLVASSEGLAQITFATSSQKVEDLPMGNFDTVAVGGTFDHLHEGHKILLSQSLFLARKTLIVGVTGPKLLVNKKYAEELESYEDRVRIIREFVARLLPKSGDRIEALSVDIYMIEDICGPTGYLEDIDALVISAETRAGGKFVNDFRSKKGMHSLSIVEIGVITPGGTQNEDFSTKLSSTAIRQRIHLKRKEKK